MPTLYDFHVTAADNTQVALGNWRGQVILVVNTASKCGFTPQYHGLESLYQHYGEKGLVILGFPCNQFGKQEPGSAEEISAFCQTNYGITFPILAKIDVNGRTADPLYKFLKSEAPGVLGSKTIKWNFTKFLIRRDGTVFKRYAPRTPPEEMIADIEQLLAEDRPS